MSYQPAKTGTESYLLRLGDHMVLAATDRRVGTVQSAVALLRTVFEDHYVDPENSSCLFFSGCALAGRHDFTVVHRGDRVILSDFTFRQHGPKVVSLPGRTYAAEVLRFAAQVRSAGPPAGDGPEWHRHYVASIWADLNTLYTLTVEYCKDPAPRESTYRERFMALYGHRKRPLELEVVEVLEDFVPRQPVQVLARSIFGPIRLHERIPLRIHKGDVILGFVQSFTPEGIILRLEGIGSGGIVATDRLYGLQLFYP